MSTATLNGHTVNGSAYPRPVEELLPAARELARELGEIPARNRLMREYRIGAPKADALRELLAVDAAGYASPTLPIPVSPAPAGPAPVVDAAEPAPGTDVRTSAVTDPPEPVDVPEPERVDGPEPAAEEPGTRRWWAPWRRKRSPQVDTHGHPGTGEPEPAASTPEPTPEPAPVEPAPVGPASLVQLIRIRWGVRAALALGVAASVAGNVLHARDELISQAISAWSPLALLIVIELIAKVPVHRRALALARWAATALIAGIAAWVSYWHMAAVASRYGETGGSQYLLPLSVDGLVVVASISLVELGGRIAAATYAARSAR